MSASGNSAAGGGPGERIGLALSGGGFRAAFFHVGVLARLAEIGVLPKVEVISTVSGGSIVGAAYYIRLRRLLNSTPDGQIAEDAYVKLVADIEGRLREAVGKNIRGRLLANPLKNLEMLVSPRYSRSDRIGDLYDRYLYKGAWEDERAQRSAFREEQIEMRELLVEPGGDSGFDPSTGNSTRGAKVPILVINATTLNTGHNWRFEATRMGEPLPEDERRAEIVKEVDTNMRLAQAYFRRKNPQPTDPEIPAPHVPENQEDFPLALAVAASAGVPGAFHPLAISDMYWDEGKPVRVQLVDGGVQDNQGVQALLDRDCNRLIVSDASGQLKDKDKPRTWLPLSLSRSASIEGDRIRDEQLTYLPAPDRKYALMHLRKGLAGKALPPGKTPADDAGAAASERQPEYDTSAFGVGAGVQRALSEIRTDLDFFSRTEALSLELNGYLMSRKELGLRGFDALGEPKLAPGETGWDFLEMEDKIGGKDPAYLGKLKAGRHLFFRLLWLKPALALAMGLLGLLVIAATVAAVCAIDALAESWPLMTIGAIVLVLLAISLWSNVSGWTARRYES
jgi:predicted acylesterase/phospholipase RssA